MDLNDMTMDLCNMELGDVTWTCLTWLSTSAMSPWASVM